MNQRYSIILIVLAVIVGLMTIDQGLSDGDDETTNVAAVGPTQFPIASSPDSLSSTWFCAGGTATTDDPFANHLVDVLNPTDGPIDVTLTVYAGEIAPPAEEVDPEDLGDGDSDDEDTGGTGEPTTTAAPADDPALVVETFTLEPYSRWQSPLTDFVQAPIASALVEGSGGLVVEHEVVSVHGRDAKPCATSGSTEWHFAWGDTSADARELLVFFNPFPDDAIIDGVFSTTDGTREPVRFEGFVVPARGTVAVDLGDDVTRRDQVAATLRVRPGGRVVVDRVLRLNGEGDGRGLTVQTGVPEPQGTWVYTDGFVSDAISEEIIVYNPTEELAEVDVSFAVDKPEENPAPAPVLLSLPPGEYERLDVGSVEGLPAGVAHRATVRSANGVPIVSERVQFSNRDNRQGISVTTGSPVESQIWYFAAGSASDTSDEWLVLANLDTQVLTEISVFAVGGGQLVEVVDLQNIEMGPGERLAIRLGRKIQREELPIMIEATEPIVVERGLYRVGDSRGMSSAIGVPAPLGLRVPVDPFDLEAEFEGSDGEETDGKGTDETEDTTDPNAPPTAPADVTLPEPDETIVIDPDEDD